MAKDLTTPDPSPVLDLLAGFRQSKTMFAASSLGVFDALASGPRTAADLARQLEAHPGALERLLDACVGLQLLVKRGDQYENTPASATYLTTTSPRRLTGYIHYSNDVLWKLWGNLEGAIKEGTPRWKQTFGWDGPIFDHFFRTDQARFEFLMGMHGFGVISSPHVVDAFDLGRFGRLVDLGGATGHLAVAACRRYHALRAVVFDLPDVLPVARDYIETSGLAGRVDVLAGDFFNDPLPEGDLYALGRILHDWSEEKVLTLLRRVHDHLPKGGGVLIAETLLRDDRTGPRWGNMQDLGMLMYTEGKERSLSEYAALLERSGFVEVYGCRTPSPIDAVLAVK